ncbi:MAG: pilus assembly protein, partial [Nitratireductor sp.]
MTFNDNAKPAKTGILSTLGDFARNRRGVAAIEFAIIAPILFAMYFLTLEFGQAIDVNKKVSRAANMAGDLIA